MENNELTDLQKDAFVEGMAGARGEKGISGILTPEEVDPFYNGFVTGRGLENAIVI